MTGSAQWLASAPDRQAERGPNVVRMGGPGPQLGWWTTDYKSVGRLKCLIPQRFPIACVPIVRHNESQLELSEAKWPDRL